MYFEHKTHEEIITDIFENVKDGYDESLQMLNYACFLTEKNNNEKITVKDWLTRIRFEIDLKLTKERL